MYDASTIIGRLNRITKNFLMNDLSRLSIFLYILTVLAACASPVTSPPAEEGVVVTFRVADVEEYKIRLTNPTVIEIARRLLAGEEAPRIPNGVVIQGSSDVNVGYSWHIDPESVEFADFTTEVCDGLPSDVEKAYYVRSLLPLVCRSDCDR